MSTEPSRGDLIEHVRRAQEVDWSELSTDIHDALNGVWSIAAANTCVQIVLAARLVGVTHWESVGIDLVLGGVYEAVCNVGGLAPDLPDAAERERLTALFNRDREQVSSESEIRARWASTVAAIQSPREAAYIRDDPV